MNGELIRIKAKVVENENGGRAIIGGKKIIEIKGLWTMKELQNLLGRLK